MKVGRSPIDEDAIRLLEQHNPDIQFDWPRILRAPSPPLPIQKEERRARDRRAEPRRVSGPAAEYTSRNEPVESPGSSGGPLTSSSEDAPTAAEPHAAISEGEYQGADFGTEHVAAESAPDPGAELVEYETLDREEPLEAVGSPETAEPVVPMDPPESPAGSLEPSAAFSRLGPEILARLRARYAEILARIAERPLDEDTREQLKQRAERLNPDSWVTADEVAQALEVYETVYDGLRAVVGTPHRRRRRGRKGRGDGQAGQV